MSLIHIGILNVKRCKNLIKFKNNTSSLSIYYIYLKIDLKNSQKSIIYIIQYGQL
jgi:hypothetical protein